MRELPAAPHLVHREEVAPRAALVLDLQPAQLAEVREEGRAARRAHVAARPRPRRVAVIIDALAARVGADELHLRHAAPAAGRTARPPTSGRTPAGRRLLRSQRPRGVRQPLQLQRPPPRLLRLHQPPVRRVAQRLAVRLQRRQDALRAPPRPASRATASPSASTFSSSGSSASAALRGWVLRPVVHRRLRDPGEQRQRLRAQLLLRLLRSRKGHRLAARCRAAWKSSSGCKAAHIRGAARSLSAPFPSPCRKLADCPLLGVRGSRRM